MSRYVLLSFLVFVGVSKVYVFYIEKQMQTLKSKVAKQKKEINLLRIEWTYLNQNARLEELAKKHLPTWKPIEAKQLKSLPRLNAKYVDEMFKQDQANEKTEEEKQTIDSLGRNIETKSKIAKTEKSAKR